MIEVKCEKCGKAIQRNPSQISNRVFCSRECSREFRSERMRRYNQTRNPMNTSEGWTEEKRMEVSAREKRNKGPCKRDTYKKSGGKHEHRAVAERMLGRKLKRGEVVHHINGDKHDNRPENLMVFASQKEHAEYHAAHPEESGVQMGRRRC